MDEKVLQQFNYLKLTLQILVTEGAKVWDFSGKNISDLTCTIDDTNYKADELNYYAIKLKRDGEYARSLGLYNRIILKYSTANEKIPLIYMEELYKLLICISEYEIAYCLIATIYADIQQSTNVNYQISEKFKDLFVEILRLVVNVYDNKDLKTLKDYTYQCADFNPVSYQKSDSEILDSLLKARKIIKNTYNL